MINTELLNMLSVLNNQSILVLEMIVNASWVTEDFGDIDSLDALYKAGWIDGIEDENGDCWWIMTEAGGELYAVLADISI